MQNAGTTLTSYIIDALTMSTTLRIFDCPNAGVLLEQFISLCNTNKTLTEFNVWGILDANNTNLAILDDRLLSNYSLCYITVVYGHLTNDWLLRNQALCWKTIHACVLDFVIALLPYTDNLFNFDAYTLAYLFTYTNEYYHNVNWHRLVDMITNIINSYRKLRQVVVI